MTPLARLRGLTPRTRAIIWTTLGVVGLAAVIFGLSAISEPKGPEPTPAVKLPASPTPDQLADSAEQALSKGDTSTASSLARDALARDPGNAKATRVLSRVRDEQDDESDGAEPGAPEMPGDDDPPASSPATLSAVFFAPVDDLSRLLPRQVSGFDFGTITEQGADAVVPLEPTLSGAAFGLATRVLLEAHDLGSVKDASAYVSRTSSALFAEKAATVDVSGTPGRFGTDGARLGAVLFSRGRFAFAVIVTSAAPDPGETRPVAVDVAKSFPTEP